MFVRSTIHMVRNNFIQQFYTFLTQYFLAQTKPSYSKKQIALTFGHDTASMKLYRKLVKTSLDHFYQAPFQ